MADTLTGLSREVQAFVDSGSHHPDDAADLAARVEEFRASLPPGSTLDEGTRLRLLVQLARVVDPSAPADVDAALALLGVTDDDADDEDDDFGTSEPFIRGKWTMDGAATLAEAATKLREQAAELDDMAVEGWTLREPIADDYGWLVPPAGVQVAPGPAL